MAGLEEGTLGVKLAHRALTTPLGRASERIQLLASGESGWYYPHSHESSDQDDPDEKTSVPERTVLGTV